MVEAYGKIENGILKITNRSRFDECLKLMEGDVRITVTKKSNIRSHKQLRYYFGIMIPTIQERFKELGTLVSREEIDDLLRSMFLIKEVPNYKTGEMIKIIRRLNEKETEVSTSEMMDYFAQVQQWAAENLDLNIPSPNEEIYLSL